jgi:hypothetical protein
MEDCMFASRVNRVVAIVAILVPVASSAQMSLEVGPMVAAYVPVGSYQHDAPYWRVGTPESPRENRGTAWGVEARLWLTPRYGVELQSAVTAVTHGAFVVPSGAAPFTTESRVFTVSAQALCNVASASRTTKLWLSAGGGVVHFGGSTYAPYGSSTRPAASLGVGSSLRLFGAARASVGADAALYDFELLDAWGCLGAVSYLHGLQADLLLHAGVALRLR